MGWFRAGFLPTVYALEKSFCARAAALNFYSTLWDPRGALLDPPRLLIRANAWDSWSPNIPMGQTRKLISGGVPIPPTPPYPAYCESWHRSSDLGPRTMECSDD